MFDSNLLAPVYISPLQFAEMDSCVSQLPVANALNSTIEL